MTYRSPWPLLAAIAITFAVGVGSYVTRDDRAAAEFRSAPGEVDRAGVRRDR